MKEAVKQIGKLLAFIVFMIIVVVSYPFGEPLTLAALMPVLLKAGVGATFFGIGGIIVGDIIVKGVVEDIDNDKLEPLEGGLVQQIHDVKKKQRVSIVEREIEIAQQAKKKLK